MGEGGRAALYSVVIQAAGPLFYPNVSLCYSLESFSVADDDEASEPATRTKTAAECLEKQGAEV